MARADFDGKEASGKAVAAFDLGWRDGNLVTVSTTLNAKDLKFDFPGRFAQPIGFGQLSLDAVYDRERDQIVWKHFTAAGGAFSADLTGSTDFSGAGSPAVKVSGSLAALSIRDFLKYWPKMVGNGARSWMAANLPEGKLGPMRIAVNLPAGALDRQVLPEDAVDIEFPFDGVTARYFAGLTPLTAARGEAKLTGDTFHLTAESGFIGPLAASGGDATISGLHLAAALAHIKTHVEGKLADVLALLDQAPLGYPKRFGINPASAAGQAAVDLDFNFPLLDELPLDKIAFAVQAKVADLGIPIDPRRKLEHGMVNFAINGESLQATGTGNISGVPTSFKWNEDFDAPDVTTRVDISGRLDDAARATLGLSDPAWLTGRDAGNA